MKAFLLTWNPVIWGWKNIEEDIDNLQNNEYIETQWDCSSKQPREGDIFFIIALGKSPKKGIFCSGIVSELFEDMPSLIDETKISNGRVIGQINYLLDPNKNDILELNYLNEIFPDQKWSPQNGGIEINEKYLNSLLKLWNDFIVKEIKYNKKIIHKEYWEGNVQKKLYTIYERNIDARNDCIKINGFTCNVCGIKLEDIYGDIGKDFIHVHHKKFHSSIKKVHKIDPKTELTTVCPNCHSMLHKKDDGKYLTIDELKKRIIRQP